MHHVSKIDPASALTPHLYRAHSSGFRRATYVDRGMGSVHMGVGVCFLDPNGVIQPHLHSFEESFYILEGAVTLETGGKIHELGPGQLGPDRAIQLPSITVTPAELVASLQLLAGTRALGTVSFAPDPVVARIVSGWPTATDSTEARLLGLPADTDAGSLVRSFIEDFG